MKRFHRPFLALLLSLLLLGSQQAAFAHVLGHIGGGATTATHYQGDHGSFDGIAETCLACVAVAAQVASAPPVSYSPPADDLAGGAPPVSVVPASLPRRAVFGARARAPPFLH